MTLYAFDGAYPINPASLKQGRDVAVCRYLKHQLPNDYQLGDAERQAYLAKGFGVLYNAEQSAGDLTSKPASYFTDYGHQICAQLTAWKVPTDQGINVALSCDTGVAAGALSKIITNYIAFTDALGPWGVVGYAPTQVIDLLVVEKVSPAGAKHWLPGAISWSGLPNTPAGWKTYLAYPHAGLVQLGPQAVGWLKAPAVAGTDTNIVLDPAAVGFHWPAGSAYLPQPPVKGEIDMFILPNVDTTGDGKADSACLYAGPGSYRPLTQAEVAIYRASDVPYGTTDLISKAQHDSWTADTPAVLVAAARAQILAAIAAIPSGAGSGPTLEEISGAVDDLLTARPVQVVATIGAHA